MSVQTKLYQGDSGRFYFDKRPSDESSTLIGHDKSKNYIGLMAAQATNDMNLQLAQQQNDWNVQQWQREADYDSAYNQRQRLLEAGINPSFADIDPGASHQLQSAEMANQQSGQYDPNAATNDTQLMLNSVGQVLGSLNQVFNYDVQNRQLQLQALDLDSQIRQRGAQTVGQILANNNFQRGADDQHKMNETQIRKAEKEIDKISKENDYTQTQIDAAKAALPYIAKLEKAKLDNLVAATSKLQTEQKGEQYENAVKKFRATLAEQNIDPDAKGMDKLINLIMADPSKGLQVLKDITSQVFSGVVDIGSDAVSGVTNTVSNTVKGLFPLFKAMVPRFNFRFGKQQDELKPYWLTR